MADVEFVIPKFVSLKNHSDINESRLQDYLVDNPELLGLGEVKVRDRERSQPSGGRLDLLMEDAETGTRYEVELQLGSMDESHIIRTIEYWDIERRRYPQYEHIAVIVAEDVTSRFLNVLSLFNGWIPLIAIQLRCVKVGETCSLIATRVVDVRQLGTEEEDEGIPSDRAYWEDKASPKSLELMDYVLEMIGKVEPDTSPRYKKHYVGLEHAGKVRNYIVFKPTKSPMLIIEFKIPQSKEITDKLENAGLPFSRSDQAYSVRVSKDDLIKKMRGEDLKDLIRQTRDLFFKK